MARDRVDLHHILEGLLPEDAQNVYFQAPEDLIMSYPCIVYKRDYSATKHADNKLYSHKLRYQVTVIDEDPDSTIPFKVAQLPESMFSRFFVTHNLNHDIYIVYF